MNATNPCIFAPFATPWGSVTKERIYHITTEREARKAKRAGFYVPANFERERFIHCSYRHQVVAVANRIFREQKDLVLLEIDPARLDCEIVEENLEGGLELFPHVYGGLAMPAVVRIHAFPWDEHGFAFP